MKKILRQSYVKRNKKFVLIKIEQNFALPIKFLVRYLCFKAFDTAGCPGWAL